MPQPSPADEPAATQPPRQPVPHTASSVDDETGGLQAKLIPGEETLDFLAPAQSPEEIGRLAQYRVLQELGRGGMGVVLLAEDPQLQRKVALKIMLPRFAKDARAKERFLREARAAAKVHHEHVITIHQIGEERGVPFIALEYLQGKPLDQYLKEKGDLPLAVALRIAREIAEGLEAAHQQGLVHRDIKPGNIWLEAPKGRVKILDFGLAREQKDDTHLTQSGAILGTPAFMAPEQARSDPIDGRADLFSLGVVLYRLCTGKQPFVGSTTIAVLTAIAIDVPPPVRRLNPQVSPALEKIILRLLEKDPAQRYGSARELSADLKQVMKALAQAENAGAPTEADVVPPAPRRSGGVPIRRRAPQRGGPPRWPLLAAVAGLAVVFLVVLAVGVYFLVPRKPKDTGRDNPPIADKDRVVDKPPIEPKRGEPPPLAILPFGEAAARKHQQAWADYLEVPVEATNKIGMELVLIPPGGELVPRAFYLGKYEVTQQQWKRVMGSNPSKFQEGGGKEADKVKGLSTEKFPVEFVTWYDCVAFCNKLSELEGRKPYYEITGAAQKNPPSISEATVRIVGGEGYCLPSEAEWEQACRAGARTKYHFGEREEDLGKYGWYKDNSDGRTHAVGEKQPNGFGLYDMHGNVREWCWDLFEEGALVRAHRGGYWSIPAGSSAVTSRARLQPARTPNIGLRVARVPLQE